MSEQTTETTTRPGDDGDPRTRRRRLAQTAYDRAQELLAGAKLHLSTQELPEALEALRDAYRAHQALELHALELRSDFHRKATLAIGDTLLRDIHLAWHEAMNLAGRPS